MSKAELIEILTVIKTHLEAIGYYAGLNDQLYAQYATFTKNIYGAIDADTTKLYSVLSGYESWHQNLQSFFTTWNEQVGEYKELLEDDLQAAMNAYMKEAYAALKARVVVQIDVAYDLYVPYNELYGNNVTMASLTYFNTLKAAIMRLFVTFVMHENNQEMLLGLMRDKLGMTADAEKYVAALLKLIADCSVETKLGMNTALATLYYLFYSADIGVGNTATGIKDLNAEWTSLLKNMRESSDRGEAMAGDLIAGILDMDIFDDIIDPDLGIAPDGFLKFFQKIINLFKSLTGWFKNLFN